MISIPAEYYRVIIVPAVERFKREPADLGLCFSACIFLYHFCEVYAVHTSSKLDDVKKSIASENPRFKLIHAVCLAAKHVKVTNKKLGAYAGLMVTDSAIGKESAFSDGTFFTDTSSWSDASDVVRVQTPDKEVHDMLFSINSVCQTIRTRFL